MRTLVGFPFLPIVTCSTIFLVEVPVVNVKFYNEAFA